MPAFDLNAKSLERPVDLVSVEPGFLINGRRVGPHSCRWFSSPGRAGLEGPHFEVATIDVECVPEV